MKDQHEMLKEQHEMLKEQRDAERCSIMLKEQRDAQTWKYQKEQHDSDFGMVHDPSDEALTVVCLC